MKTMKRKSTLPFSPSILFQRLLLGALGAAATAVLSYDPAQGPLSAKYLLGLAASAAATAVLTDLHAFAKAKVADLLGRETEDMLRADLSEARRELVQERIFNAPDPRQAGTVELLARVPAESLDRLGELAASLGKKRPEDQAHLLAVINSMQSLRSAYLPPSTEDDGA